MNDLREKLGTLCIFRELLKDKVLSSLCAYLDNPTSSAYAGFVAVLYECAGGNLGEYIKELCSNSENVYVKTVGRGDTVPKYMTSSLKAELDVLQEVAELNKEKLCSLIRLQRLFTGVYNYKIASERHLPAQNGKHREIRVRHLCEKPYVLCG